MYNRFDKGSGAVSITLHPEGIGTAEIHDYTIGITASRSFENGIDVGLTLKTFDVSLEYTSIVVSPPPMLSTTRPVLLDVGAIYTVPALLSGSEVHDMFSLGVSLQNFGSNFKTQFGSSNAELSEQPIRFLRFGFAYDLRTFSPHDSSVSPVRFLVTAEYRRILNSHIVNGGQEDFYGFGAEATALEMLIARVGGYLANIDWIYSTKGVPSLRYGFGLHVPFQRIGVHVPLTVELEYGAIPIHYNFYGINTSSNTLKTLSLDLAYEQTIF
jgi:hypothetical protein